jgi:hypothetical protein
MPISPHADSLRAVHILQRLSDEELTTIAGRLRRETFAPGQEIVKAGTRPNALFLILEGEGEFLARTPEGSLGRAGLFVTGDTLGEQELFYPQLSPETARATRPTTVARWEASDLVPFLRKNPTILQAIRLSADSRHLARKLRFRWLAAHEVIYCLTRKHIFFLWESLTLPLLLLAGSAWLGLAAFSSGSTTYTWGSVLLALAGLAFGVWQWIDWANDYFIVTNRRVVWLEKIVGLYDSRQEAPLSMVLAVDVATGLLGRLYGFGDVTIRTYTGRVPFRRIGDPYGVASWIEELRRRLGEAQQAEDRAAVVEALRGRLGKEQPSAGQQVPEPAARLPEAPTQPPPIGGLGPFQIRFEGEGFITYRKHWAVLVGQILAPSMVFLALAVLLGAHLGGWIHFFSPGTALAVALLLLIPTSLWWLYRYMDWANDLFQVSSTHIIDLDKKPLGPEERKLAPLESILGTEVDRKGLIGLLLNYGDVVANVGTTEFVFEDVMDPTSVQQDIVRAQEALILRKRQMEQRQRRDEMVEFFGVYDEERRSPDDMTPDSRRA